MNLEIISKYPSVSAHATPLLFVHGAWHAAWCWDVHFLDHFAQHGFAAHAVSLRGHGKSEGQNNLRWTRIADYVDDVAATVRQLPVPPVIIGHSMGGFVVQKYLERCSAPAAVLLASAPPAGILTSVFRIAMRHPLVFLRVNLMLSPFQLVGTPSLAREILFSEDLAYEQLPAYTKQLQEESAMAFYDMLGLDLPKPGRITTPMLVLGGSRDNNIKPGEIMATARAYNAQSMIFPDVAHDMMLEPRWQSVADRIVNWLKERNL